MFSHGNHSQISLWVNKPALTSSLKVLISKNPFWNHQIVIQNPRMSFNQVDIKKSILKFTWNPQIVIRNPRMFCQIHRFSSKKISEDLQPQNLEKKPCELSQKKLLGSSPELFGFSWISRSIPTKKHMEPPPAVPPCRLEGWRSPAAKDLYFEQCGPQKNLYSLGYNPNYS